MITRYDITSPHPDATMREFEDGPYVKYEDVRADLERLEKLLAMCTEAHIKLNRDNTIRHVNIRVKPGVKTSMGYRDYLRRNVLDSLPKEWE